MPIQPGSKRLIELDGIRGIAAMLVVVFHYAYRYQQIYPAGDGMPSPWLGLGTRGVDLFFMVSGFVIFWTVQRCANPRDFIVSRLTRLFPAYLTAVVLTSIVVAIAGLPGREHDLLTSFINLTMVQELFGVPHIDGAYWSLTVELLFYYWITIGYYSLNARRFEYALLAVAAIQVFVLVNHYHHYDIQPFVVKILVLKYLHLFIAGICFFKIWSKSWSPLTVITLAICFAANFHVYDSMVHASFVSGCFVLMLLVALSKLPVLGSAPLVYLGSISYALYLVHQNIGYVVMNFSRSMGVAEWLGAGIALCVAIAIAHALTYLVEAPVIKLLRQRYATFKGRSAVSPV